MYNNIWYMYNRFTIYVEYNVPAKIKGDKLAQ